MAYLMRGEQRGTRQSWRQNINSNLIWDCMVVIASLSLPVVGAHWLAWSFQESKREKLTVNAF